MKVRVLRHTTYQGIPIVIENEAGSEREGPWGKSVMTAPYGYIEGVRGAKATDILTNTKSC